MQPSSSANVSMDAIREAIARRAQGGGGTPPTQQMTSPQAMLPTGGANVPQPSGQAPPVPQNVQQNVSPTGPQGSPVSPEGAVVGKLKQGAAFDDETKTVAKQLVAKLIGVL